MDCERCEGKIVGRPFVIMTRERRFESVCEACWEKEAGQQAPRRFGGRNGEQRHPPQPEEEG